MDSPSQFCVHWTGFYTRQCVLTLLLKSHHQLMAVTLVSPFTGAGQNKALTCLTSRLALQHCIRKRVRKGGEKSVGIPSDTGDVDVTLCVCCSCSTSIFTSIYLQHHTKHWLVSSEQSVFVFVCVRTGSQHFSSSKCSHAVEKSPAVKSYFSLYSQINFSPSHVHPSK